MTTETRKKDRRSGCYSVAVRRARQARRSGLNPVLVALVFGWAFLSAPFGRLVLPAPVHRPRGCIQASPEEWAVTDYERGVPGALRPWPQTSRGRYRSRPSLAQLMRDLCRPAARKDAAAALATRIPDAATRTWVAEKIRKGEINRISIYVRPGRAEDAILSAWREEANVELAEKAVSAKAGEAEPERGDMLRVARLLESLAGTETVTSQDPTHPTRSPQ